MSRDPDSDKISIWTTNGPDDIVVRRTSGVDYWEGEPPADLRLSPPRTRKLEVVLSAQVQWLGAEPMVSGGPASLTIESKEEEQGSAPISRMRATWATASLPGSVGVARFAIGSRTNSSTRRTVTARAAAPRPARRSSRSPASSGRSSRSRTAWIGSSSSERKTRTTRVARRAVPPLLRGAGRRLRSRRAGVARRRSHHSARRAHLRRLQGILVRDHRRPAAIRGARLRGRSAR